MRKRLAVFLSLIMILCLTGCNSSAKAESSVKESESPEQTAVDVSSEQEYIESVLNLANNEEQEWTYVENADAWVLSVVSAVAYPELPDQQGISVFWNRKFPEKNLVKALLF